MSMFAFTNLQAMCQVAVSIREVRLEFQGCAVRCNGLWDVSRILKVKRNIRLQKEKYREVHYQLPEAGDEVQCYI